MLTPLVAGDPRRIGPFEIHNRIGAGGMGSVYLGFNADGRAAAVKVPADALAGDPEFRARFRREVEAARRVRGRSVAAVLDADPDATSPWLATEYVEGTSLADAVLRQGPLEPRLLHGLGVGLADALVAIHAAGVVHRDLKPSNILLAWDGPKVIDFGIARASGMPTHTRTGILVGTPAWMAPEQLRGERAGPAADVFAWGACITYAATGHPPFGGSDPADILSLLSPDDHPDLNGVPPELLGPVRAALSRRPGHRPTAARLVATLVDDPRIRTPQDADRAAATALTPWNWTPPGRSGRPGPNPPGARRNDPDLVPARTDGPLDHPERPEGHEQPTQPLAVRADPSGAGRGEIGWEDAEGVDSSLGTIPVPRLSAAIDPPRSGGPAAPAAPAAPGTNGRNDRSNRSDPTETSEQTARLAKQPDVAKPPDATDPTVRHGWTPATQGSGAGTDHPGAADRTTTARTTTGDRAGAGSSLRLAAPLWTAWWAARTGRDRALVAAAAVALGLVVGAVALLTAPGAAGGEEEPRITPSGPTGSPVPSPVASGPAPSPASAEPASPPSQTPGRTPPPGASTAPSPTDDPIPEDRTSATPSPPAATAPTAPTAPTEPTGSPSPDASAPPSPCPSSTGSATPEPTSDLVAC